MADSAEILTAESIDPIFSRLVGSRPRTVRFLRTPLRVIFN